MTAVNEMTFGVEFELTLPNGTIQQVGGYHHGAQIPGLPDGWNAQHDGSIRAAGGRQGVEVVSPILRGIEGLEQIEKVCEGMKLTGAKVNASTGFHIHIGFDRRNKDGLRRLVSLVANFEKALFAST